MKQIKRIVALVLCITVLLCGCDNAKKPVEEKPDETKLYNDAVDAVRSAQNLSYTVTQNKSITVGNQTISENRTQSISCQDHGSEKMSAIVDETVKVGDDTVKMSQIFYAGQGYINIDDLYFTSKTKADTFMAQFSPAILLNPNRYRNIEKSAAKDITVFLFNDAISTEDWAMPSTAFMKDAQGDATLDKEGRLIASTYRITYIDGPATVTTETIVALSHPDNISISAPENTKYEQVSNYTAPKLMETACLYLNNVQNLSFTTKSNISSNAFGIIRDQTTQATVATAEPYAANINTQITQQDYSSKSEPTIINQTITFENGTYTTTINGIKDSNNTVTHEEMASYCHNLMFGNIPSIEHLTNASAQVLDGHTILKFETSDKLSDLITRQISSALYGDETFIETISDTVDKAKASFYFVIHNQTGLPTSCGYSFATAHKIDSADYTIKSVTDQSFHLDTLNTAPPANSMEPLFYCVTDDSGSTLWLLGSTQYGDSRSASLPMSVYAALTQSQAIVMEYSYDSLLDRYGTLSGNVSNVSKELYDKVIPYLFLTGSCNTTLPGNAAELENNIRHHFIAQGYRLNRKNSIQNRIYQFAIPSGKRIDILYPQSSPLDLCKTLSPAAQELLLQNTLNNTGVLEQNAYLLLEALYQGNDSAMVELLRFDTITDDTLIAEELTEKLYAIPAENIAQSLGTYLEEGKTTFAVVDASYLIFNGSILDHLRQSGYTVTRY